MDWQFSGENEPTASAEHHGCDFVGMKRSDVVLFAFAPECADPTSGQTAAPFCEPQDTKVLSYIRIRVNLDLSSKGTELAFLEQKCLHPKSERWNFSPSSLQYQTSTKELFRVPCRLV